MTMTAAPSLLIAAGQFVKSLNPMLVSVPPPAVEVTGKDVCYLGPNGEESADNVTYCEDLFEGQRAMVGSWYLHPERHAVEFIVSIIICIAVMVCLVPNLPRCSEEKRRHLIPPFWVKVLTFFTYTLQLIYKSCGYPGKLYFLAMPCNVIWGLWALLCFWPGLGVNTAHALHQVIYTTTILAYAAVAAPDLGDLIMFGEVPFFFFMHFALIGLPLYFHYTGRITMIPEAKNEGESLVVYFAKWWILSLTCFSLFYQAVVVPLCFISGLNINYMLHPPPTPGDFLSGPNFRLYTVVLLAAVFFVIRFVATTVEVCVRSVFLVSINREKNSKKSL